jgi:hypothetical protein
MGAAGPRMLLLMLLSRSLCASAAASPPSLQATGDAPPPRMPPGCNAAMDAFCGNATDPELAGCYALLRRRGKRLPMVAGLSGPCYIPGHCTPRWHCYSPSDLAGDNPAALPVLERRSKARMCWPNGTDVCNCSRPLLEVLDRCDGAGGPGVEVFHAVAVIPALVYALPTTAWPQGSLVAYSEECGSGAARRSLCSRYSTDHGHSWSGLIYPATSAGLPDRPGPDSGWVFTVPLTGEGGFLQRVIRYSLLLRMWSFAGSLGLF